MMSDEQNDKDIEAVPTDPLTLMPAVSQENLKQKNLSISRFSGILYALFACFLFTLSTFCIKELKVDFLDALLLRFFLQAVMGFCYALYKKYTLLGGTCRQISLQIFCSSAAAAGLMSFFLAVRYSELSDVITIAYTRVIWTIIFSSIAYREKPAMVTLLALPMTLSGVVLVTQPPFLFRSRAEVNEKSDGLRYLGFIFACCSAITSSINVLLFKELISSSKDMKPSVLNFQFCCSAFILLASYQVYKRSIVFSWRFFVSTGVSMLTIFGSILVQKAIKREHPSVFSLLCSSEIIFALIFQNLFTSTHSNLYTLLGSGLVIASVLILGLWRIYSERQTTHQPVSTTDEQC